MRTQVLNDLDPYPMYPNVGPINSTLYLNGSIGLFYSDALVKAGQAIARDCNSPDFNEGDRSLCNDLHEDYQGDYYHVITAAFLGCRQAIMTKQDSSLLNTIAMSTGLVDQAYLTLVRMYKIDRFVEQVSGNRPLYKALRTALTEYDPLQREPLKIKADL